MTSEQKQQLAASYRTMTEMFAWKHFRETILEKIRTQATQDEDAMPVTDLNPGFYGVCRGRRQTIERILREVENILNPLP